MKNFLPIACTSIFFTPLISLNAHELGPYWYGFGIGTTATLCNLEKEGLITNEVVDGVMLGMRQAFSEEKDRSNLDMDMFNRAVKLTKDTHPTCQI